MNKQKHSSALLGAAFIMAITAMGPGFLIQTGKFTNDLKGSFGFVILFSILLAMIVQLNVWRVLCVTGLRGQDVANKVLPGLGHIVSTLVVLGGLVFNIGNVGGGALGFNTLLGIPVQVGYFISGAIAITIFLLKDALKAMDNLMKMIAGIMLIVILIMIILVKPNTTVAVRESLMPSANVTTLLPAILTLLGGTVGGYITFAGAHRLIDGGVTSQTQLKNITYSSVLGLIIAAIIRLLLFLAIFGVVSKGVVLDASNPTADAFLKGAGELGYRFFGVVSIATATTSIVGAAYTSVSFLKTLSVYIVQNEKWIIIIFIAISTVLMALIGNPVNLLVIAGAVNGLILPITLGICLVAAKRQDIMPKNYQHPKGLWLLGSIVLLLTAYIAITSLGGLAKLFW